LYAEVVDDFECDGSRPFKSHRLTQMLTNQPAKASNDNR
jgi:hypothetical protein